MPWRKREKNPKTPKRSDWINKTRPKKSRTRRFRRRGSLLERMDDMSPHVAVKREEARLRMVREDVSLL